MAVIGCCENGLLVDHQRSISESVSGLSLCCKDSLFALFVPYFRSSVTNGGTHKRKRKKALKGNPVEEEEDTEAVLYHQKVKGTILKVLEDLVRTGIEKRYFSSCEEFEEDTCKVVPDKNLPSEHNLFGHLISHLKEEPALLNICGQPYIIPPQCTFLMSDSSNLQPLVDHAQQNGLYNLVVLDPPWYNKSARRGSKYSFMSLWQIKALPVPQLLASGALVGIWVTNKQKYLRFTKSELFPHWSVELVAQWYWVKVTRRGELVTDLDSPHKKPYEHLLIGRFKPEGDHNLREYCSNLVVDDKFDEDKKRSSLERRECWNTSSPQMKRKRLASNESDTNFCIQDLNKIATAADGTDIKNVHDMLQTVTWQKSHEHRPMLCGLKHLLYKLERSSDADEFSDLRVNEAVCNTGTDINLKRNVKDTGHSLDSVESSKRGCERLLPYEQVICSVPCRIHSRKPPLNEILSCYIPPSSRCLEMFARNLTPHWTSWGNEVLKFQSMEYFTQLPAKETDSNLRLRNLSSITSINKFLCP